jgi:hypothetical protein
MLERGAGQGANTGWLGREAHPYRRPACHSTPSATQAWPPHRGVAGAAHTHSNSLTGQSGTAMKEAAQVSVRP